MNTYYPKRPVKSFQDLEIYQKALGLTAEVFKKLEEDSSARSLLAQQGETLKKSKAPTGIENVSPFFKEKEKLVETLLQVILELPKLMAKGHGLRFAEPPSAVKTMEEAMLTCNKIVVYLELYRDLCNKTVDFAFFDENIKDYLTLRFKILHLIKSWERIEKSYSASLPSRKN